MRMGKIKVLGLVHGGFSSHTIRVLEIAKAMRETGNYEILFSGQGPYMETVEDAGFKSIETKGLCMEEILITMDKFIPRFYSKKAVKELFPTEDSLLQKTKPDIIIRDYFRELAGIAAKQYGIYDVLVGYVNVCPYYTFDFVPPNIPKFIEYLPRPLLEYFGGLATLIRQSVGKELHKKSRELGLKVNKESYEGAEADLVLLTDSEAIFPLSEKPDKYKYLGPLLVLNDYKTPSWIESFMNDKRKKIVISCGSSGKHEKTDLFVEAFQDNEFAVSFDTCDTSNKIPEDFYGRCPLNINSLLPHADAFINHGGIGSTYLGLKHGVPMLGIYAHWEQSINAFTIENLGAGLAVPPKKRNPQIIKGKIYQLIHNSEYKKNAMALKERLEKDSPLERAVEYIKEGFENFKNMK